MALEEDEGSASRPSCSLPPVKDPVPTVQEARWAPGPVRKGAENLAPTGIRSPDRPARSQSLYRLRYPAHILTPYYRFNPFFNSVSNSLSDKCLLLCTVVNEVQKSGSLHKKVNFY